MLGRAAMAGAMMHCTPMTVNPELTSRLSTGRELGGSSSNGNTTSSSDSIRCMSSWGWSGSFTDYNNRGLFAVHGVGGWTINAKERRRSSGCGGRGRRFRIVMRSGGDKNDNNLGDDGVETLFMRELRRRGMSTKEKEGAPLGSAGTDTKTKEEGEGDSIFRGWSLPGNASTKPPPQQTESQRNEQLKRSQALNSEGLDGLIPRGTELLKLGSRFFLTFWPFILACLGVFGAVYLYFGSAFIHTGNSFEEVGRPPYVDPYQLLEEEVITPQIGPNRVPFDARTDDARTDANSP